MDTKESLEEPPPYTAVPTNLSVLDGLQLNSLTSHLRQHITFLPDRIRKTQQAWRAEQTLADASLLDHIVPIIEEFLDNLGARHNPVPLATLTLVPGAAIPRNAVLSGLEDMKRRGETCRVSKISIDSPGKDSKSSSGNSKLQNTGEDPNWAPGQEFTDWGRFNEPSSSICDTIRKNKTLWWQDEEMACRLASYLQPKEEKRARIEHSSIVQAVVEQRLPPKKEKKGWGWGKRTNNQEVPDTSLSDPVINHPAADEPGEEQQKRAEMTVTAQEVAFRQENEFGIWESIRGWGIIVTVKVRT